MNFPLFNTKALSDGKTYNLNDPTERRGYFKAKLGSKIEEVRAFLEENTFVGFLVAKKSAGKGTYTKMFEEIIGSDKFAHIAVGDTVRAVHEVLAEDGDGSEKREIISYLEKNYRGFISLEEAIAALIARRQDKLIPTEFIMTLIKREIEKVGRKALFIDGLPRSLDQISYSLYFRDLINFRYDPDFFILIDVPEAVIDERMRYRVVCPVCHTSRNIKLLPTKFVKYDKGTQEFYLVCDNDSCSEFGKARMVRKEGDDSGIESIRERLKTDHKLLELAKGLQGIPHALIRNSIPVDKVGDYAEEYELTPAYEYKFVGDEIKILEAPWTVKDDYGVEVHSLLAPAAMISLFTQIHDILLD